MSRSILILCCASLAATSLAADANSDFKSYMRRSLPKMARAFDHKDWAYFDKNSTADFTDVEMGHTLTKAQSMSQMKMGFQSASSIHTHFKLLTTKANGDNAVATTFGHMTMVMKPMGAKDKPHHMVVDMWETETYVRSGKGWKIKKFEQTKPMKMTMDGKALDPSKMGG